MERLEKQHDSRPAGTRAALALVAVAFILLMNTGCSRRFWRNQADQDTYDVIADNLDNPNWYLPRIDIEPDPQSRFYDPYDPDHSPLPPDDPAANRYMVEVAGMRGYKSWHKLGEAISIENPHWWEPFGLTQDIVEHAHAEGDEITAENLPKPGIENLNLRQALELSYIFSREYQTAIEDLYLAALALTFERFQFQIRFLGFGGREPSSDLEYDAVRHGPKTLDSNKRFGVSKLLPTGGQWIVELANNTLWIFTGGNRMETSSVLSYSLVQPLLLGAGRKVVLEDLTQGERDVLYVTRDLARFRKQFFTDTVGGGPSGGFLGLLQQQQLVSNQAGNIRLLEDQLTALRELASQKPPEIGEPLAALPPGFVIPQQLAGQLRYDDQLQNLVWRGPMSDEEERMLRGLSDEAGFQEAARELIERLRGEVVTLEVAQLESRLAQSLNSLRTDQRRYQDQLDLYKIQLGLPPDFELSINDSLLRQFELIDPSLEQAVDDVKLFVTELARLDEDDPDLQELRKSAEGLRNLIDVVRRDGVDLIRSDIESVRQRMPDRLARLRTDAERDVVRRDVNRDRRLFADQIEDIVKLETALNRLVDVLSVENVPLQPRKDAESEIKTLREKLVKYAQTLEVIQIGQRVELIILQRFTKPLEESVATGLANRLDLKNVRAQVMDARRVVEVQANRLESVLNIRVDGDVRTPIGVRPFEFRGDVSNYRAGIEFTAPLDQVAERNDYRAALINYQRARRDYMAFEDNVKLDVRQSWRQLEALEQNFEIARQAIRIAATQFDQAVEEANAPAQAGGGARDSSGRGLNLLNALDSVLDAQDSLIGIWINYERNRLNIYRDMGTMEIDAQGVWDDDLYQQGAQQVDDASESSESGHRVSELDERPFPDQRDIGVGFDHGVGTLGAPEPRRLAGRSQFRRVDGSNLWVAEEEQAVEGGPSLGLPGGGGRRGRVASGRTPARR